jgi:hypothetical protein
MDLLMKNNWIKIAFYLITVLCNYCFAEVDTTICILIQDSIPYHVCARVQGKSKSDKLSAYFYVKEHGEDKCLYRDTIVDAIGEEGFWDSLTMHTKCHTQEECRWYFITTEGKMILPEKHENGSLSLNINFYNNFKKQLKIFLISKANMNIKDASIKVAKLIKEIENDRKIMFSIFVDPVMTVIGPFLWIEETKSFFRFQRKD